MISPLDLNVPPTALKSSYLYRGMNVSEMHDSLATVVLDNGYIVDAGWYPRDDPNGSIVVRVLWDRFDTVQETACKTVEEAVEAIEALSWNFCSKSPRYSNSSTTIDSVNA
jgi:hypothetical protein